MLDKNYPLDTIAIRELPQAIRQKGENIIEYIKNIEEYRSSNLFSTSLNLFPDYRFLFIHSNSSIPAGLYFKTPDSWVGYSNYSFIPQNSTNIKEGTRVTYGYQTYELKNEGSNKIWVNKTNFTPVLFFDFFETNKTNIQLKNKGFKTSDIEMILLDFKRDTKEIVPFVIADKFTSIKTNKTYLSGKLLTYSALFKNIVRLYSNDESISETSKACLLSINDEFQNIRIGLCYDKENKLYFYNKEQVFDLSCTLSSHLPYQLSMKFFENKLTILVNNEELEQEFDVEILDKNLFFGLCSDMSYGRYSNASCLVSEPQIFDVALSAKENLWLMENPRTWNFLNTKSYINLTLDEQLKLKKNINTLDKIEKHDSDFKKIIEDKFLEQNQNMNQWSNNTTQQLQNLINSKLSVIEEADKIIKKQKDIVSQLNTKINSLEEKIFNLEQKLIDFTN